MLLNQTVLLNNQTVLLNSQQALDFQSHVVPC